MADSHEVYDLFNPSPPSLKHFACTAVALDLWRCEVKHHLKTDGTFRTHDPERKTSLQCLTSLVPPKLFQLIERYAVNLAENISKWIKYHANLLPPKFLIFDYFMDFCCDLDGKINAAETAKRILLCDKLHSYYKFLMACLYCFEEDIFRLWPRVSRYFSDVELLLECEPANYYWINRLNNQLSQVVLDEETSSVEEAILKAAYEIFDIHYWPLVEYILNRLSSEDRTRYMVKMFGKTDNVDNDREQYFCRYVLQRLDKETLRNLVNTQGVEVIASTSPWYTMFVWEYIKNEMTADVFSRLVKFILRDQTESWSLWLEIWPSAPNHLKKSALPGVLEDGRLFDRDHQINDFYKSDGDRREVSVLMMILLDTPVEFRKEFWDKNWRILMPETEINDLRGLMNLCFDKDQNQINQFKKDTLICDFKLVFELSCGFLKEGSFEDLNDFLKFWFANDEVAIRDIRLKLLHEKFAVVSRLIKNADLLNKFIDETYLDVDLATNFKNQLLSSPKSRAINALVSHLRIGCDYFPHIMTFVDTFKPSEALATQIKEEYFVPEIVKLLCQNHLFLLRDYYKTQFQNDFAIFMNWLLRNENRIAQFKETLNVDAIVLRIVEHETNRLVEYGDNYYLDNNWFRSCFQASKLGELPVKTFLKWYFHTPESFEEFASKYADNEAFVQLMLRFNFV